MEKNLFKTCQQRSCVTTWLTLGSMDISPRFRVAWCDARVSNGTTSGSQHKDVYAARFFVKMFFLITRSMRWINDAPGCSMFLSCLCLVALERVVWHGEVTIHYTSRSVFFIFDRLEPIQVIHGQHLSSWWTLMVQLGKTKQSTRSCKPWWILSPSLNITPQQKYNWSSDPHMDFRLQSLRILENWKPLIILYSVALLKYLKCKQIISPIPILSKHTLLGKDLLQLLVATVWLTLVQRLLKCTAGTFSDLYKSKYWLVLVGDIFFSLVCTVFHQKM